MENQNPIPPNPVSGSQTPTPPPPIVQNETKKRFPIPKYAFLGIFFIVLLAIIGSAFVLSKNSVYKEINPTTPAVPSPDPVVYEPTPTRGSIRSVDTSDWNVFENAELIIKYPPEYSHATCTLSGNNDNTVINSIGIDTTSNIKKKNEIGCELGLKPYSITITVTGENNSIPGYLKDVSIGPNDAISGIEFLTTDGGLDIGYITRYTKSDQDPNNSDYIYAFQDYRTNRVYSVLVQNKEFHNLLINILSTVKFKE